MLSEIYERLGPSLDTISAVAPVLPAGYNGDLQSPPFIYFNLVAPKGELQGYDGSGSLEGVLTFAIYADKGTPHGFLPIVDVLDQQLTNRTFGQLKTYIPGFQELGLDSVNKSLLRFDWVLPFKFFGEP
jgi:hypothetical protein